MAKNADAVFLARESGSTEIDGETFVYSKGVTRVREGHPLLKAVPDYFEPVGEHVHYDNSETAGNTSSGTREQ